MAIIQLPFKAYDYTAWKQIPLSRVMLYSYLPDETDGAELNITNLDNTSTFELAPITRKDTFGIDRTVAYRLNSVLKPINNHLYHSRRALSALTNSEFKRAIFYFTKTPSSPTTGEYEGINTYQRASGDALTISDISTSFVINGTDITITINAIMSKNAFIDANTIIINNS